MSIITEIADLSLRLVNRHFQSKQNLLEENLLHRARERHWQSLAAYGDARLSAVNKLMAVVDAHFHPRICSQKKIAVWRAFYGEAKRCKVYRKTD